LRPDLNGGAEIGDGLTVIAELRRSAGDHRPAGTAVPDPGHRLPIHNPLTSGGDDIGRMAGVAADMGVTDTCNGFHFVPPDLKRRSRKGAVKHKSAATAAIHALNS